MRERENVERMGREKKKLLPDCRVSSRGMRPWPTPGCCEQKNKNKKCIETRKEIFHFTFRLHFAIGTKFSTDIFFRVCARCPIYVCGECQWPMLLLYYYCRHRRRRRRCDSTSISLFCLATMQRALERHSRREWMSERKIEREKWEGRRNFRTIISRVHLVIENFRCRFGADSLIPISFHFSLFGVEKPSISCSAKTRIAYTGLSAL